MIIPFQNHTPLITSVLPSTTVHCRLLLVEGIVPQVATGQLQIRPHNDHYETVTVCIVNDKFRSVIPLVSGDNEITLTYHSGNQGPPFTSTFYCTYTPLLQNPPLKLCIILGSDSPCRYDDAMGSETNTLESAVAKLRMAGYLWQSYTASEMSKLGHGFRTFHLDSAWQRDTITTSGHYDTTAKIHILRSNRTTAEIRDPDAAQQNGHASRSGSLFDIALDAISHAFGNDEKHYCAALFMDAHFDGQLIRGHAALGGGTNEIALGIFGSHTVFSWPSTISQIESCFTDDRDVPEGVGIDGEGRKWYAACAVGIGAMMHEVGHAFGSPHQPYGVMLRDYPRLHRSFTALEPRNNVVGEGECRWHPLDLMRYLAHPAFRVPGDMSIDWNTSLSCLPSQEGMILTDAAGIIAVEFYCDGKEFPADFIMYETATTTVYLKIEDLRKRVADGHVRLNVIARNNKSMMVNEADSLLNPDVLGGRQVWQAPMLGYQDGRDENVLCLSGVTEIIVYSGICLDGLVLHGKDGTAQQFGQQGGSPSKFTLNYDEYIVGTVIRSGAWLDGIQFITNQRRSDFYGNRHGGGETVIRFPAKYQFCGLKGQVGNWVNKLSVLYTKI